MAEIGERPRELTQEDKNVAQFEFEFTTLLNVLKTNNLTVPRYQRSYSWEDSEVDDFWNDLNSALDDNREYFLGTVVLSREADAGFKAIIDGQQRLATATILLAAVRDALKENGKDDAAKGIQNQYIAPYSLKNKQFEPKVRLNSDDNTYYISTIVEGVSVSPTRDSHNLIAGASKKYETAIEQIVTGSPNGWEERLSSLVDYLDTNTMVVVIKAATEADAYTIFETLNDRGADLTIADLLKNFLFSMAKSDLAYVQENWVASIATLNLNQPNQDYVNFLRHLWSSKEGATRERDLYREIRNSLTTQKQVVSFSESLLNEAKNYAAILGSSSDYWNDYDAETRKAVDSLNLLGLEQNRPLLLAVLQHFTKADVKKALKLIVGWSVRGLVAGVVGGGKAEKAYCDAAQAIRSGIVKKPQDILSKMGTLVPSDAQFLEDFKIFRTTNNAFARYVLHALENKKRGEAEPELVPNTDAEAVNLEHILPKNAKPAEWPAFSPDEAAVYVFRLGNMTLLRKSENRRIGNKPWTVKQPALKKSSLNLNLEIVGEADWIKAVITSRQDKMAPLAVTIWPR
jgi:uncharacterized protein with ParB-like and HNH nuclease domain